MTFTASYIPIFNQAQMDLLNELHGLDGLGTDSSMWIGEFGADHGEPLASAVLVGPVTADTPMVPKNWDSIVLDGEGRAMVIVWIDSRKVATGFLNMAGGPGEPNKLNIPFGFKTGKSLIMLIVFRGRLLGSRAFYE